MNKINHRYVSDWFEEQGHPLTDELGIKFMETLATVNFEGNEEAFFMVRPLPLPPDASVAVFLPRLLVCARSDPFSATRTSRPALSQSVKTRLIDSQADASAETDCA